jgi:hypothetical protein
MIIGRKTMTKRMRKTREDEHAAVAVAAAVDGCSLLHVLC